MKIFVDMNNGDNAKIYYARYARELFEFTHSTNIPLSEYNIDETENSKTLCVGLRRYAVPTGKQDINSLNRYYFYIPTGKIRERENWEEYTGEE